MRRHLAASRLSTLSHDERRLRPSKWKYAPLVNRKYVGHVTFGAIKTASPRDP